MKHIARKAALVGWVLLALSACTQGPAVRVDADPAVNVAAYRSFGFLPKLSTDEPGYSTLLSARLKDSARRALEAQGLVFAAENPELLINFNINVVEMTELHNSTSLSAGYYDYRRGLYGAWAGYPYDFQTTYKQGTLTIDAVDASRNALVWQGVAERRISRAALKNPAAAVDEAVRWILAKFPGRKPAATAATP